MTDALYWLTLTVLITALVWIPYVLNRIMELGVKRTLGNPDFTKMPKAKWALRLRQAHQNATENLVIFAMLVLISVSVGESSSSISIASQVYFFARLLHLIVYAMGIPVIRTIAFLVGFSAQLMIAFNLLT